MWKVYLENLINFNNIGFRMYVGRVGHDGSFDLLTKPTLKHLEPNGTFMVPEDSFLDDSTNFPSPNVRSFLQAMSDAAWEIGIKPKQIEDNSNELKATKYHLEDMRTIVLKEPK